MDIVLIGTLIIVFVWSCFCLYQWHYCIRQWRYWEDIARINREELDRLTDHLTHAAKESYDKGYALGLHHAADTMYEAAARGQASGMLLAVLRYTGHELTGSTDETHEIESEWAR